MFQARTLFVVGAGASKEARLPIGQELTSTIADMLDIRFEHLSTQISGDFQITDALRQHVRIADDQHGDINPHLHAGWRIRDAMPQAISIDSFIEAHQGDEKIELCGKLAIVRTILKEERNSLLFVDHRDPNSKLNYKTLDDTWYNTFTKLLTDGFHKRNIDQIFENVSFIVFNYDRCIEHFLFHALQNYYGIQSEEATKLMQTLTIHHPYGMVGALEWQGGEYTVPFGGSHQSAGLLALARQIKTFSERIEDESVTSAMRKLVQDAEVVVFLGFAFHRQNMELIKPAQSGKVKRVFATAMGISDSDAAVVTRQILNLFETKQAHTNIELRNGLTCCELFGEYWRSF